MLSTLKQETKRVFESLDKDKDSYLAYEEFRQLTELDGEFRHYSESDMKAFYDEADLNHDNKISFEEFCHIIYDLDDDEDDDDLEVDEINSSRKERPPKNSFDSAREETVEK